MMGRPRRIDRVHVAVAAPLLALVLTSSAVGGSVHQARSATVRVTFTDRTLRVFPANPQSGRTTFVVRNRGRKLHRLVITGPGLKHVRTRKLAAGKTAKLTVMLRAGTYELSDPVGLGVYQAQFLQIIPATSLSATGNSSVVTTPVQLPVMCAGYSP